MMKSDANLDERHSSDETALTILPSEETSLTVLPLFLLDDEDRRRKQGLSYKIPLKVNDQEGTFEWQVNADPSFGFPDSFDHKVFKILEYLALQNGLPLKNPIHFSLYQILQFLGLPPFGVHFARVRSSLQRIAAVKIHAHFIQEGARNTEHQAQTFHLYDDVTFQEESFGNEIGAGSHQVTFGSWYLTHLNKRLVQSVQIEFFQRLQNPIATRLYELLSAKFGPVIEQNQKGWEISYPHLCQLLPIREAGWMSSPQRQLEAAHDELIMNDFIDRIDWTKGDDGWMLLYIPGEQARAVYQERPEASEQTESITAPSDDTAETGTEDAPLESISDQEDIEEHHTDEPESISPEEGLAVEAEEQEETATNQSASKMEIENTPNTEADGKTGAEDISDEADINEEAAVLETEEQAPDEAGLESAPVEEAEEAVSLEAEEEPMKTKQTKAEEAMEEAGSDEPIAAEDRRLEEIDEVEETISEETDETLAPVMSSSQSQSDFTSRGVSMFDDQNGQHAVCDIQYHVAWMTKSRDRILNDSVALRTRDVLRDACTVREVKILRGKVAPDHVHLQLSCPPTVSPADLVNDMKERVSRKLQEEYPALQQRYWGHSLWAGSYLCVTVGNMADEDLERYLDSQKPEIAGDESFQVVPAP